MKTNKKKQLIVLIVVYYGKILLLCYICMRRSIILSSKQVLPSCFGWVTEQWIDALSQPLSLNEYIYYTYIVYLN